MSFSFFFSSLSKQSETSYILKSENWLTSLKTGFEAARSNIQILATGLIQSLFEGAMYSWVFIWTPAMQRGMCTQFMHLSFSSIFMIISSLHFSSSLRLASTEVLSLPFGWIFASFMVSVMIGSVLFGYISKYYPTELLAKPVYSLGSIFLFIPALVSVNSKLSLTCWGILVILLYFFSFFFSFFPCL